MSLLLYRTDVEVAATAAARTLTRIISRQRFYDFRRPIIYLVHVVQNRRLGGFLAALCFAVFSLLSVLQKVFAAMENLDIEKFINEIHIRPAIWDMRSDDYADKIKKKRAWEEVIHVFIDEDCAQEKKKQIGTILQKKWKNIRDRYGKELKDTKGKSGDGRRGKTSYMYANQLAFLTDVIQCRQTETSMDETDVLSETRESAADIQISKKRKQNIVERRLLEALDNHTQRQNHKSQKESCYEDDHRLFLLSLLPFLKSVPPHFQFAVRMDIMQSINKYITVQPPAGQPQAPYMSNTVGFAQSSGHQSTITPQWQHSNVPCAPGVQSHSRQIPVIHLQEPQQGQSGIQQQHSETPIMSPTGSMYSQDSTDLSLF